MTSYTTGGGDIALGTKTLFLHMQLRLTLSHLNPFLSRIDVLLRLSAPGGAVTAAASRSTPKWSRAEWTQNCAGDLMAVAKYALGILFEHYPDWFESEPSLNVRHTSLIAQYEALQ